MWRELFVFAFGALLGAALVKFVQAFRMTRRLMRARGKRGFTPEELSVLAREERRRLDV